MSKTQLHRRLMLRERFHNRLARNVLYALCIVLASWGAGIVGYHALERLSWIDSTLNAAMILGGMGPVNPVRTFGGKLFASFYALYSGMVFLFVVGMIFGPFAHRLLHKFHLELDEEVATSGPKDAS
jgi:hypothetical protein